MKISAVMRNPSARHIDFTQLAGLIPSNPKFLPSNLDMVYERNGRFLVAEWKRPGENISGGQERLLRAMAKVPGFIVLIVTGDTDDGVNVSSVNRILPTGEISLVCNSADELLKKIRGWYEWVSTLRE